MEQNNEQLTMNCEQKTRDRIHSLISVNTFKAVFGIDDRDEALCRYCLITATFSIEEYCRRRLLLKTHYDRIEYGNDLYLVLHEFPVRNVVSVYALYHFDQPDLLEPEFYELAPDKNSFENVPYMVVLSPAITRLRSLAAFRVVYRAGYRQMNNEKWNTGDDDERFVVPPDLGAACLELAGWNFARYRGKRIGVIGNTRGNTEHFEMSMPLRVRELLEPYKRITI